MQQLPGIVAQYEVLRNAALGHALPAEARSGLQPFLRRGLWGWARVLAAAAAAPSLKPRRETSLNFLAEGKSTTVIHIFAAMALGAERRGATL